MSAEVFEYGYEIGYQFSLLDIGGGFYGDKGSEEVFQRVASAINSGLDSLFNSFPGLTVIAEPGMNATEEELCLGLKYPKLFQYRCFFCLFNSFNSSKPYKQEVT